jgi:hypothetical protein
MMAPKMSGPLCFLSETAVKYEQFYSGQEHLSAEGGEVAHNFS